MNATELQKPFSQRLPLYVRASFIFDDELRHVDGKAKISDADLALLTKNKSKIDENRNRMVKSYAFLLAANLVAFRGSDLEVEGFNLSALAGAQISAALAAALSFSLFMLVVYFQNSQIYSALISKAQELIAKNGDIDGAVMGAWNEEDMLLLKVLSVPTRFMKTDNVLISKIGKWIYSIAKFMIVAPLLAMIFAFFPTTAYFLTLSGMSSPLAVIFLIFGWFTFVAAIVIAIIPFLEFTHQHVPVNERF